MHIPCPCVLQEMCSARDVDMCVVCAVGVCCVCSVGEWCMGVICIVWVYVVCMCAVGVCCGCSAGVDVLCQWWGVQWGVQSVLSVYCVVRSSPHGTTWRKRQCVSDPGRWCTFRAWKSSKRRITDCISTCGEMYVGVVHSNWFTHVGVTVRTRSSCGVTDDAKRDTVNPVLNVPFSKVCHSCSKSCSKARCVGPVSGSVLPSFKR